MLMAARPSRWSAMASQPSLFFAFLKKRMQAHPIGAAVNYQGLDYIQVKRGGAKNRSCRQDFDEERQRLGQYISRT
jgi:hypothetical protein